MEKPRSLITKTVEKISHIDIANQLKNPDLLTLQFEQEFAFALEKEIPKSESEINVIDFTNKYMDEKAKKYINETFSIESKNVHKIPHKILIQIAKGAGALYIPAMHHVFYSEALPQPLFIHSVNHEILHAKSYNLFQSIKSIKNESLRDIQIFRGGVSFVSRDGKFVYLENLNEAITETIAKEATEDFYKKTGLDKKLDNLVSFQNTYYNINSKPLLNRVEILTFQKMGEGEMPFPVGFSYEGHRRFLQMLISDIFEKNKNNFSNLEEVKEIFFESYFTGKLLKLQRMIDQTYGNGTFKNLTKIDRNKHGVQNNTDKIAQKLNAYILELKERNINK